ncbi:hypothetical protein [Flavobacterium notoginsengisoli]|uniref:hypothetical protein n=1 Tax=Flavobacterium notoginsengisoli TaxID=1478199 RepID=UPI00363B6F07
MKHSKKHIALTFIMLISIYSCRKTSAQKWDQVIIDPKISQNKAYKELNKEQEIFSFFELLKKPDSTSKRSSGVSYYIRKKNEQANNFPRNYNCRAYFFPPRADTLSINIGIGNGFGGNGFIINLKNNKFYTEAYYSTDVIIEGETKPTHKVIYQKLILDKANYRIGDSLFGYIDFKSIETDKDNNQTNHSGKGYFRTKVKDF